MRKIIILGAAFAAFAAAPAPAATVVVEESLLRYKADPGEVDDAPGVRATGSFRFPDATVAFRL